MVASSNPYCDGTNCILVGLSIDCCHIVLYQFYDKSWTMIERDNSNTGLTDVEVIGKKVYVSATMMLSWSILVYDVEDCINGPPKAEFLIYHPKPRSLEPRPYTSFLARDEALKCLYIIYMLDTWESTTREVNNFEVFQLELNGHIEWKTENFKDRVAFVSGLKSTVLIMDKYSNHKESVEGNSVYFTLNSRCSINPASGLQLGNFSFTNNRIKYVHVETDSLEVPQPVWFEPNLW